MGLNSQAISPNGEAQGNISHYRLDFLQNGKHHYYIWRQNPLDDAGEKQVSMLIDLNHVFVPDHEIEKMVFGFVAPTAGVSCIAFANCHSHNQQEIKRKLKAGCVKLYSKTAFFTDLQQAKLWLETQCAR